MSSSCCPKTDNSPPIVPGNKRERWLLVTGMVCMDVLHTVCVCIFVFAMEFQELDAVAQTSLVFPSLTADGC